MNENIKKIMISLLDAIDAANEVIKISPNHPQTKVVYDDLVFVYQVATEKYLEIMRK